MATSLISAGVQFPDSTIQTSAISSGTIVIWSGSIASIPDGWYLCDGQNGTPDLRNRFIVGAGNVYSELSVGGSADARIVAHNHNEITSGSSGAHTHTADHSHSGSTGPAGSHTHTASVTISPAGSHSHTTSASLSTSPPHSHPISVNSAGDHTHPNGTASSTSHTHPVTGGPKSGAISATSPSAPTEAVVSLPIDPFDTVATFDNPAPVHSHTGTSAGVGNHVHPTSALSGGVHSHSIPSSSISTEYSHSHTTMTSPSFAFTDPTGATVHNHTHPNANDAATISIGSGGSHSHPFSTSNPPGSSPVTNANLPPFYALAFIMKG